MRRLDAIGLSALSGYGFLPADLKVVGPEVNAATVREHLQRGLDRAHRLHVKFVVFGNLNNRSRQAPEGFSIATARQQLLQFVREAGKAAKAQDITVLIEPLPTNQTNLINTVADALSFVAEVARPNVKMLVDYTYMAQGKEDMSILRVAAAQIRQVEISNPNGRVYPRTAQEADYLAFLRPLGEGGFRGGISIHGRPEDFFVDAPRAIELLRTLVLEAAK